MVLVFLIGWIITPLPKPLFENDYSTIVVDTHGHYLRIFLNNHEQWILPDLGEEIPNKLKICALQYEDRRFYSHPGIDPIAIARALWGNLTKSGKKSGASTITMQVARLAKPKKRNILGKIIEAYHSLKLELKYNKRDILKLYFQHAPYGGNIIGYQTASLKYWGKMPFELTWGQAATIAVLPNNPSLINPQKSSELLKSKRDWLLKKLQLDGFINEETYELSIAEPIPEAVLPFEMIAPHLSRELAESSSEHYMRTTIDREIQIAIEELILEENFRLKRFDINNIAVLVAETSTGKVRAYIGSHDFTDNEFSGQVDGVKAPRSTGSILKPFLYSLCMDNGIILPETKIKDIPTYYGAFSPYNADMDFRGLVAARKALVYSLNVPAVRLLYTFGIYEFYEFLKQAGMTTLFRSADEYGLPLILGGAEGTLWDITSMYRGLGCFGNFMGLNLIEDHPTQIENRLLSPGASYLVLDILKDLNRPGADMYWQKYETQWPVAWKTGTSYGHRDAWAVGVSPQWTIGVWAGNFSGEGNPNIIGAKTAGPILFSIYNALPKDPNTGWFEKPPLETISTNLCAETGYLAGEYCADTLTTDKPTHAPNLPSCPYHRKLYLSDNKEYQVCSRCWSRAGKCEVIRLVYPPEVIQFMSERGQKYHALPPHYPECPTRGADNPLSIIYPVQGANILVTRDISGEFQNVVFKAASSTLDDELFWYLDNSFLGSTLDKHSIPVKLSSGNHSLRIINMQGYSIKTSFQVTK